MNSFREKVVVLTGASRGIGEMLALLLAQEGAWLVLAARSEESLQRVCAACVEAGGKAVGVPTDVSIESDCEALIVQAVEAFGRIDVLVNNAGMSMWARFSELQSLAPLRRVMDVNYFGSVFCTYYALPYLKETRGLVVGISSLTGKTGVPTRSGYAASKHAMAGFFDSLRIELMEDGVDVTMIYPGFVATDTRKVALGADGKPLGTSPVRESEIMTAEECAVQILHAMRRRRRELVMTWLAKFGMWLKLLAPSFVDRIAKAKIERGK